jgi:hypothetical protein
MEETDRTILSVFFYVSGAVLGSLVLWILSAHPKEWGWGGGVTKGTVIRTKTGLCCGKRKIKIMNGKIAGKDKRKFF